MKQITQKSKFMAQIQICEATNDEIARAMKFGACDLCFACMAELARHEPPVFF